MLNGNPLNRDQAPVRRRPLRRNLWSIALAALLATTTAIPMAVAGTPGGGLLTSTLPGIAPTTPQELSEGTTTDLLYADVTEGLATVQAPEANSSGTAELAYPLRLPKGRGMTPEVSLNYSSEGASSWSGLGWDLSAPEVAVDTSFGAPRFCDGTAKSPPCGNVESESYTLDGDQLVPNAFRAVLEPRSADRQDFTRKVETEFEQVIRHGDKPSNYWWEVRDKLGNIRYYGGTPDNGGPLGEAGTQVGIDDRSRDAKGILTDKNGNGVRWFLMAKRDIGVNMFRYEYDTVTYQRDTSAATGWKQLAAGAPCPGGAVCAKHVYLSKILYTAASTVSGEPEDPAYEVRFVRTPGGRTDAVLDARGGVLDLEQDLLDRVDIVHRDSGKVVTRYDLTYSPDPHFAKSRLASVTQIGCNGLAACPATGLNHTFTYYDDIATAGSGFDKTATWKTGLNPTSPGGTADYITSKKSPLGASQTEAGDGRIYVGFNPATPSKTGSVGGSFAMNGSTNESVIEFIDLNGDSLPDKVYREVVGTFGPSGPVQYQLNTSKPSDTSDTEVQFGPMHKIDDITSLPVQSSIGIQGGIEAYFGVYGVFNIGGQWSWVDSYFTDANGDGLTDLVMGTKVYFNRLVCAAGVPTAATCLPTFSSTSAGSRVPLASSSLDPSDPAFAALVDKLRAAIPPVDTVRRWIAPFEGNVSVTARATLSTPLPDSAGGAVRVAIQKAGAELTNATITAGSPTFGATLPVHVDKGQALYFRAGSRPKGNGDAVTWEATITYAGGSVPDANGLNQRRYSLADDFTLAGRPDVYTSVGNGGAARFTATLDKTAGTSDDLRPEALVRSGATNLAAPATVAVVPVTAAGLVDSARVKAVAQVGSNWCVKDASTDFGCFTTQAEAQQRVRTIGQDETGLFRVEATPTFAPPALDADGVPKTYDAFLARLAVDSPIDLSAISWTKPGALCFTLAGGGCDETKTMLAPHMDIDTYPLSDRTDPAQAWTSTLGRSVTPHVAATLGGDNTGGEVVLTVKTSAGAVYKEPFTVASGGGTINIDLPDLALTNGTKYWFDLTVRTSGLSSFLSDANLTMTWTDAAVDKTEDVPETLNWAGPQGYFPIAYRGWAAAGYTATGPRATTAIVEADFRTTTASGAAYEDDTEACQALFGGACPTDTSVNDTGFSDYEPGAGGLQDLNVTETTEDVPDVFAYRAVIDPTTLAQRWEGPRDKIFAAEGGATGSARVGRDLPLTVTPAAGGVTAPNLLGETGPIFMLMAGVGPIGGSLAFGWSRSMVDYMDMNGDGFPDTVRPGSVTYTNPRGTQECQNAAGATVACTGGGVSVVDSSTTIAVSGGFGGAPIGISGNVKGTTNSTKGGSATKGSNASETSYGANIGGSIGLGKSWTNPTIASEANQEQALENVPSDETLPLQETLADINGDGLPDRIIVDPNNIRVRLNLGHSYTEPIDWSGGAFSASDSFSGSIGASLGVNLDNGGFAAGIAKNSNVDLPQISWDDVNGDGLIDAIYRVGDDIKIAFSNGIGLTTRAVYGNHQSSGYKAVGVIDVEGQQQMRQDSSESLGGGADVTVGIPLCLVACYLILNPGGHYENSMSSTDVDLTDVNGDGYADTVSRSTTDASQMKVALNTQGRTNLLQKVTTPMGGALELDYHRDGNTVEHPDSQWVFDELTVTSSRGADGISQRRSTMSYGHTAQDFILRSDLGYDRVTVTEHYTAYDHAKDLNTPLATPKVRTTVHAYLNDSVFESGLETSTTVYDGTAATGVPLQRTRTTWSVMDLDKAATGASPYAALALTGATPETLLAARATAQVSKVEQDWYAGGSVQQTTAMTYKHDRLGNTTEVEDTGLPGSSLDDTRAVIDYSNCETSSSADMNDFFGCGATLKSTPTKVAPFWTATNCQTWNSQPVGITVYAPEGSVLRSREGRNAYCDNNSVTVQREALTLAGGGVDTYAETRLTYDQWGSYNRIVMPPDADGKRYAVRYVYDDVNHASVGTVTDFEVVGSGDPDGTDPEDTTRRLIEDDEDPTGQAVGLTSQAVFDGPTGRVKERTDANGNTTSYTYDAYSRVRTITSPDGGVATFGYHPDDVQYPYATVMHTDEFNPGTTIDTATYVDGSGRITGRKRDALVHDPVSGVSGAGFAAEGGSDVDGLGRTIHQWKPFLQVGSGLDDYTVDVSNPTIDKSTVTTYDVLDRALSERGSNGATTLTAYGFDSPTLHGSTRTVDVTDPAGRHTKTWLDAHANVLVSEDQPVSGPALRTSYTYDRLGQITRIDSPGGLATTHTYDLLGRRTSTTTPDGGLVEWEYDLAGNKVTEQSPVLREEGDVETVFAFDFGLLTSVTYPGEAPVTMDYGGYLGHPTAGNAAGKMVHLEDKARIQTFAYDTNGRLAQDVTKMTGPHPNTGPFTTSYDNDWLGRLSTVSLPDGETVRNDYDTGGRLTEVVGNRDCRELGVLTTATNATATTITVTEYQHADPASSWAPTLPFTITLGSEQVRVTARTPGTTAGNFVYTVERGVNGTLEVPTAGPHAAGSSIMADVAVPCFYRYLDQQRYDVYGRTSERMTGNGVQSTTYRNVDTRRLERKTALSPDGGQELQDQRYSYDIVGNVVKAENHLPADVPALFGGPTVQNYTYDSRYRLTKADGTWDYAPKTTRKYTWSATLDDATSRVQQMTQRDWTGDTGCTRRCKEFTQEATTFDRTAYTYDPTKPNQATAVYDAVTKETETYAYDSDGEQTTVTNPDTIRNITWDWAGKMVEIVDHNANNTGRKQTDYVYDWAGKLATEIKEQGVTYYVNPWVTVRNGTMSKNIWAGNDRLAVKFSDGGGTYETRLYFLHTDLQGSTNIVTNRVGKVFQHQEYFPTGQVWIREDSTIFRSPWQFGGGYTDEDHGLVNFGDRWYSPEQARFLTVDPILTDDPLALVQNPILTSAYTYGQPNPTGYVDTDGRVSTAANLNAIDVLRTIASLEPDGEPISQAQSTKLLGFFAKNADTARGRQALGWLKNYNTYQKRQTTFFDRLDSRPVLEFELDGGKLKAIKLGFGVGKRLKFDFEDKGAGATPQTAKPVQNSQGDASGGSGPPTDANGPGGSGKSAAVSTGQSGGASAVAGTTKAGPSSGTGGTASQATTPSAAQTDSSEK